MKCSECQYCVKRDDISLMSRMMGYTAECARTGTLLTLEDYCEAPQWCPLREAENERLKL